MAAPGASSGSSNEQEQEPWRVLASSAGTWSQVVGRRSQEEPGRAKMDQGEPQRRGDARPNHGEPGEPRRVLASTAGTWSHGGGQEKPREVREGQDGSGWAQEERGKPGRAMRSQGSHDDFCRVLLKLGARSWAGGAKRSHEGPRWARKGPRVINPLDGEPGRAMRSQGSHGEFWRVLLGLGASSGEFCWDLERGGGQDEPSEARMSQGEPG